MRQIQKGRINFLNDLYLLLKINLFEFQNCLFLIFVGRNNCDGVLNCLIMKIVLLEETNSRKAGGLYYSVRNLALSLKNHCGEDVSIVCCDDCYSEQDKYVYENVSLKIYKTSKLPFLKKYGYSSELYKLLEEIKPDIIDVQGIWLYYSYVAYKYKRNNPDCKVVITPRGMLDRIDISTEPIYKRLVYALYEKKNLNTADAIVALCTPEIVGFKHFKLQNPIAVIPNGFTLSKVTDRKIHDNKVFLFIGRINPKKGILEFIEGINILNRRNPQAIDKWTFRIAGWDQNGHVNELISRVKKYNLESKIIFIGQVYGKEKENELLNADAFVLTSFSEGLPMSVLEAWAYSIPVLMTDGCNLPDGFERNAAVRTTCNPEYIANDLEYFVSLSDQELLSIGRNGYRLVQEKYQWNKIAEDHVLLYDWLLGRQDKPLFIM